MNLNVTTVLALRKLVLPLAAVVCVTSAAPIIAVAQSGQTPLARRLFDEGVEAARTSKWTVARDRFKRSYELAPRPKTLFNLAGAQMQTGQLVDASESYRSFLRKTNDGRYEAYRKDARDSLSSLEKRIPFVTLRVIGVSPGDKIELDEEEFPQAGLGESMPIDPGSHSVDVKRRGAKIATRTFTIGESDAKTIDIVVKPAPEPVDPDIGGNGPGDTQPAGSANLGATPATGDDSGGVLSSGWFWTAVAVVAIGGAGAGYFLTRDQVADPTQGTLGRGVIDVAP